MVICIYKIRKIATAVKRMFYGRLASRYTDVLPVYISVVYNRKADDTKRKEK